MGDKARIDELKKMLELGVISQSEFDTLFIQQGNLNQTGKIKWWKNKWFFVSTGILLTTAILFYLLAGSPEKEATELSKSFVACQLQNNLDYLNALYDVNLP